eukprot:gb/GFBE01056081.1/.p1 GENE.gb/GFBE01056081.1/~~gb/GFBE01056081.1/.p1  ORF type:complete len:252 (+),score=21.93 gb/GFBE01056081.1/:1-756(+)
MYGGMQDFGDRPPRSGGAAVMATRIFEARVSELEVVGKWKPDLKQRAKQVKVRPWQGWKRAHIPVATDDMAGDDQLPWPVHQDFLAGAELPVIVGDNQAQSEVHVIEPWFTTVTHERREDVATPRTARRTPRSRGRQNSTDSSLQGSYPANSRKNSLLPRPALPKLPQQAAAAACWPAGKAAWRWPVPAHLLPPPTTEFPLSPEGALPPPAETWDFIPEQVEDGGPGSIVIPGVPAARGPPSQPWWQLPPS